LDLQFRSVALDAMRKFGPALLADRSADLRQGINAFGNGLRSCSHLRSGVH